MKKKFVLFVLVFVLLTIFGYANLPTIEATISDVSIELNGSILELKDVNGEMVKPLIVNGTTYLPVRAIGQNLGLDVDWNGKTKTVVLTSNAPSNATSQSDNVANSAPVTNTVANPNQNITSSGNIKIAALDKKTECIIIKNSGNSDVSLAGWTILSVRGEQRFRFPEFTLKAGDSVKVGDKSRGQVDFHWLEDKGVWNNSKKDDAELYNGKGELVDRYED